MHRLLVAAVVSASGLCAQSFQERAETLSREIAARHMPHGTILDPVFASPASGTIVGYSRCGDSAIWTGHYLAAESFRYRITRSPEALEAARRGLRGIQSLVDVTGADDVLARCLFPADSPYSAALRAEESNHGQYAAKLGGADYVWIGHTSRDQYLGVFFGLSVAYELIEDSAMRATAADLVTRLVTRLLDKGWAIVMPDGSTSTVFWLRPDQQLAILQVARQMNPARFRPIYEDARRSTLGVGLPISIEVLNDHDSYFKFNLAAITFYTLIRLEEASSPQRPDYIEAYDTFRGATSRHGNAQFNVIDRALKGADAPRDAETIQLLNDWMQRPRRDTWEDLRSKYAACGDDRACEVIPVAERVRTDFLWQRSPFLLYGGGAGTIESAGIDFILPYWMGRYYGMEFSFAVVSAASGGPLLAPDSIGSIFGSSLAASTQAAPAGPLPLRLGGVRVEVTDAAGAVRSAPLYFVSPAQINFVVPDGAAPGVARVAVVQDTGARTTAFATVQRVAPALFTANSSGQGPAAALAFRLEANGQFTELPVFRCAGPLLCYTQQIDVSSDRPVYLSLFGTGIRHRSSLAAVSATLGGKALPVLYAGPQNQYAGLDQVNVQLPRELRGMGEKDLALTVDGSPANLVRVSIR